jgi:hypothetical protein
MIRAIDNFETIIHSLECKRFEMTESEIINVLGIMLYPNEVYSSLTNTQIDKIRDIINSFNSDLF